MKYLLARMGLKLRQCIQCWKSGWSFLLQGKSWPKCLRCWRVLWYPFPLKAKQGEHSSCIEGEGFLFFNLKIGWKNEWLQINIKRQWEETNISRSENVCMMSVHVYKLHVGMCMRILVDMWKCAHSNSKCCR